MKGIKVSGLRTQRIDVGGLVDWEKKFLGFCLFGSGESGWDKASCSPFRVTTWIV